MITGFRVARGGAQERYGVLPDLTILGKIVGGGLPLAAFGGRAELMEQLAPVGVGLPGGHALREPARDRGRALGAAAAARPGGVRGARAPRRAARGGAHRGRGRKREGPAGRRDGDALPDRRRRSGTSTTRPRATPSATRRSSGTCSRAGSTSRRRSSRRCSSRSPTATPRSTGPSRPLPSSLATEPWATIAAEAARESPLWAAGAAPGRTSASSSPSSRRSREPRFALGLETIYEGYLLHFGRPRLFAPTDLDTAILLGDYLYAHGLVRVAGVRGGRGGRRPGRPDLALLAGRAPTGATGTARRGPRPPRCSAPASSRTRATRSGSTAIRPARARSRGRPPATRRSSARSLRIACACVRVCADGTCSLPTRRDEGIDVIRAMLIVGLVVRRRDRARRARPLGRAHAARTSRRPAAARRRAARARSRARSSPSPTRSTRAAARGAPRSRFTSPSAAPARTAAYGTRMRGGGLPAARAIRGERLLERQVLAAEQVALAAAAALEREQVAARDVAHVDEVHARGVDVAAVAAARDARAPSPGRRRRAVALADRRRRVDDDRVEPGGAARAAPTRASSACTGSASSQSGGVVGLGRDPARDRAARRAARGVDEPAHARAEAGVDHVARPVDVDRLELGLGRVEAVERGDVEDRVAARDLAPQPVQVEQVDPLVRTSCPRARSARTTWPPMNPRPPPVT